jgi:hypothetical protein
MRKLRPTAHPDSWNAARRASDLLVRRRMHENADAAHPLALLRARRERPRSRGAWDLRD